MIGLAAAAAPNAGTVLRSWSIQPAVLLPLVDAALLYVWLLRRVRSRSSRSYRRETWCFMSGLAVIAFALLSPIGRYSDQLLSVNMVEHLLLMMVAPPLLLLGAPVTLALQASGPSLRKRYLVPLLRSRTVRFLSSPILAWGLFAGVLWVSHFSSLYERTLESGAVHDLEHVLYLFAALLFWRPVVAKDPAPGRLSGPARLFYLFLAMPVTAFLGMVIYGSDHVLYSHYATATAALGISPLGDQQLGGAIMWVSAMVAMLPALGLVLYEWLDREDREASRADARLADVDRSPPG
jgi:putative membrane protein